MSFSWQLSDDCGVSESLRMMAEVDTADEDTVIVALDYRCNNRCSFCMIANERAEGPASAAPSLLEQLFRLNGEQRHFRRLTISGAEATLHEDLPAVVKSALDRGGFEVVRLQTNARRLANKGLVRELMAAGLTEYFISLHAADAPLHGLLTGVPAGFEQTLAGIRGLLDQGARVISNTMVSRQNYRQLPAVAELLLELGVRECQLWSFVEVGEAGQEEHHVRYTESIPFVLQMIETLSRAGVEPCVKWFPRCLLGRWAHLLDNHQPPMLIQDAFQRRLADHFGFSCCHGDCCDHFRDQSCAGLPDRYREVFGDERDHLVPLRSGRPPSVTSP